MAAERAGVNLAPAKRGLQAILKSYFYWTYQRGSFHYDIMVTLILAFIFVTPWLWNYGAKPSRTAGPAHPILVSGNGGVKRIWFLPLVH